MSACTASACDRRRGVSSSDTAQQPHVRDIARRQNWPQAEPWQGWGVFEGASQQAGPPHSAELPPLSRVDRLKLLPEAMLGVRWPRRTGPALRAEPYCGVPPDVGRCNPVLALRVYEICTPRGLAVTPLMPRASAMRTGGPTLPSSDTSRDASHTPPPRVCTRGPGPTAARGAGRAPSTCEPPLAGRLSRRMVGTMWAWGLGDVGPAHPPPIGRCTHMKLPQLAGPSEGMRPPSCPTARGTGEQRPAEHRESPLRVGLHCWS